jgi:hypothetical protein
VTLASQTSPATTGSVALLMNRLHGCSRALAAVVHHGGTGTTGAAVASGRPQVVCPFVADQPFWARRMHLLGVAPLPIPPAQANRREPGGAIRSAVATQRCRGEPGISVVW